MWKFVAVLALAGLASADDPICQEPLDFSKDLTCPNPPGECPVYYPHENTCSLYYECSNGVPVLMECPPGLQWNIKEEVCDFPIVVNCTLPNPKIKIGKLLRNPTVPLPAPLRPKEDPICQDDKAKSHWAAPLLKPRAVQCPYPPGECPVFFPHETECTLYYMCDAGIPVLRECPDGLHWSVADQVCDHWTSANCNLRQMFLKLARRFSAKLPRDDEEICQPEVKHQYGERIECPYPPGECPEFFPHESECTLYYMCDAGIPVLRECPDGLHWSVADQVCDHWTSANCNLRNQFLKVASSVGVKLPRDDEEICQPEVKHQYGERMECPYPPGECPEFFPHESECTLYYMCDAGIPILRECPDGLHWSVADQVCDHWTSANCNLRNQFLKVASSVGVKLPRDDEEICQPEVKHQYGERMECPYPPGECPEFFPHESECTLYYMCDAGIPILRECPDGLHWSVADQVCDHWTSANCNLRNQFLKVASSVGVKLPRDDEEICQPEIKHKRGERLQCPYPPGECPEFFPHESECTLYYMCDAGHPILRECPDGLHWSVEDSVCDHPLSAGCE